MTALPTRTGFLSLPGEMRNQIYDYIDETIYRPQTTISHRFHAFLTDTSQERISGPIYPHVPVRPFLSLTQACRTIRGEFRPIYMSKLKIGVDLQYMVKYFETFSPVHGVSEDFVKGYKGEVMVLVPVTRVIKDKQAHSTLQDINKLQAIDILPAIKFLLKCPHMRCSFIQIPAPAWRESDIEELHDLNRLIDRRANSMSLLKTISHVTYSITQVEVRITLLETQTDWVGMRPWLAPPDLITFIFDGRAKEDWMDGRPLRRSDSWKDKDEVEMNVKRYLELTGMEDIEEHRWRINAFAQVKEHILEDSTSL